MFSNRTILTILLLSVSLISFGQKTKAELEREKKINLKKLEETNKILNETKTKKKANIGQLNALKQQEEIQKAIIKNVSDEITILNSEISETQWLLDNLKKDLDTLKKDYANMVYQASKASNSYNKIMFLFSSAGFYDLVMRINYLKQYTKSRKQQVEQIQKVSAVLEEQQNVLLEKQKNKRGLLNAKVVEKENLVAMEKDKEKLIISLTQEEKDLKKQLAKQKKDIARLEKMIAEIVRKEMAKLQKGDGSKLKLTPEAALLSKSFAENKGRLIWPVQYGFIYSKFGQHWHPTIKGVKVINIGVDIQTRKESQVRAVFDGDVVAVASVPGMNKMVMIQHGEYFTVYTKITNVFVKSGDKIKRKEPIGITVTNSDNVTIMQFQVWKNTEKLDPELWLTKP